MDLKRVHSWIARFKDECYAFLEVFKEGFIVKQVSADYVQLTRNLRVIRVYYFAFLASLNKLT